jgi:hypothetical protein
VFVGTTTVVFWTAILLNTSILQNAAIAACCVCVDKRLITCVRLDMSVSLSMPDEDHAVLVVEGRQVLGIVLEFEMVDVSEVAENVMVFVVEVTDVEDITLPVLDMLVLLLVIVKVDVVDVFVLL